MDPLMLAIMKEYGVLAAVVVYLAKTLIWDPLRGSTNRYIKAINDNTKELKDFREETKNNFRIAFHNIKEVRDKNGLGPVTKPTDLEN